MPYGSLMFINPEEGWMVGSQQNDLSAPGGVYHTTDGGLTWTLVIATAWQGKADFVDGECPLTRLPELFGLMASGNRAVKTLIRVRE